MKKETQYHTWYWIAAFLALMVIQWVWAGYTQISVIPYSEFQDDLKAGKVDEVRVSGNCIQGKLKQPDKDQSVKALVIAVSHGVPPGTGAVAAVGGGAMA